MHPERLTAFLNLNFSNISTPFILEFYIFYIITGLRSNPEGYNTLHLCFIDTLRSPQYDPTHVSTNELGSTYNYTNNFVQF